GRESKSTAATAVQHSCRHNLCETDQLASSHVEYSKPVECSPLRESSLADHTFMNADSPPLTAPTAAPGLPYRTSPILGSRSDLCPVQCQRMRCAAAATKPGWFFIFCICSAVLIVGLPS